MAAKIGFGGNQAPLGGDLMYLDFNFQWYPLCLEGFAGNLLKILLNLAEILRCVTQ